MRRRKMMRRGTRRSPYSRDTEKRIHLYKNPLLVLASVSTPPSLLSLSAIALATQSTQLMVPAQLVVRLAIRWASMP